MVTKKVAYEWKGMGGGKCYKTVNKYLKKNVSTKSVFDMEQIQSENNEYPSSIYYNSMRWRYIYIDV